MKILVRWFLLAAALLLVAQFYSGVTVASFGAALAAATGQVMQRHCDLP